MAQYTAQKLLELGAVVLTMSDRGGFVYMPDGLTREGLDHIIHIKTVRTGGLDRFAEAFGYEYFRGQRPWKVPCEMAFPCATQNELDVEDATELLKHQCCLVCEGANMPTTYEATKLFEEACILFGPGKAANAGGVAISAIEMTQNSMRMSWSREEVDAKLQWIMAQIHQNCVRYGEENGHVNYIKGANIAGFKKVADAMLAYGVS